MFDVSSDIISVVFICKVFGSAESACTSNSCYRTRSLFVLGSPLFASNTRPLSIRASDVDLRSVTLTAPYLALGSAAAVLILSKNVVPVLSAMEEPTFVT